MIPSQTENPNGLHQRYQVRKADGSECDPRAIYFVLRLDDHAKDAEHAAACRAAALAYAEAAPPHLSQLARELEELVLNQLEENFADVERRQRGTVERFEPCNQEESHADYLLRQERKRGDALADAVHNHLDSPSLSRVHLAEALSVYRSQVHL